MSAFHCTCGRTVPPGPALQAIADAAPLSCGSCGHAWVPAKPALASVFSTADPRLVARFEPFLYANIDVWTEFVGLAQRMRKSGRKGYSAWPIMGAIRFNKDLRTVGDPFKINNDFIALYVRLLIYLDPSFEGFFELRAMKPYGRKLSGEERERTA